MTNDDDITLLRKWRTGDRQAGNVLIRRHFAYALGIAKRRLRNDDDANDAALHAMEVLVQKQGIVEQIEKIEQKRRGEINESARGKSIPPFRAYLSRVVYFSALNQFRDRQRRHYESLHGDEANPKSTRGASTLVGQKEEEKLLVKALRSLSIDDQLVFYYKFTTEKDPAAEKHKRTEIAEILELTPTQIDRRFHHAKRRARKRLEVFRDSPVGQSTLVGLETWLKSMHAKLPNDGEE
jgi:RNA polymerase sigma-70 factor (ECF subfamily)